MVHLRKQHPGASLRPASCQRQALLLQPCCPSAPACSQAQTAAPPCWRCQSGTDAGKHRRGAGSLCGQWGGQQGLVRLGRGGHGCTTASAATYTGWAKGLAPVAARLSPTRKVGPEETDPSCTVCMSAEMGEASPPLSEPKPPPCTDRISWISPPKYSSMTRLQMMVMTCGAGGAGVAAAVRAA